MKLYYFNPNRCDAQFFLMAESEEKAIEALNKYLDNTDPYYGFKWGDEFFKASELHPDLYPGYTIEVFEANQVFETEKS